MEISTLSEYSISNIEDLIQQNIGPFDNLLQIFNFRVTASYYLCYHALNREPIMEYFGKSCNEAVFTKDSSNRIIINKHYNDSYTFNSRNVEKPFECALFSFCPDTCCHRAFTNKKNTTSNLKTSQEWLQLCTLTNPCSNFGNGVCELSNNENKNIDDLKLNKINITCQCKSGYRYNNHFKDCLDIDECNEMSHNCFGFKQVCLNTIGSFICLCDDGYSFEHIAGVYNQFKNSLNQSFTIKALESGNYGYCQLEGIYQNEKTLQSDHLSSLLELKN
jgi:hypothetical protein